MAGSDFTTRNMTVRRDVNSVTMVVTLKDSYQAMSYYEQLIAGLRAGSVRIIPERDVVLECSEDG